MMMMMEEEKGRNMGGTATASRRGEPLGELPAADLSCSCRKSYTPAAVMTESIDLWVRVIYSTYLDMV